MIGTTYQGFPVTDELPRPYHFIFTDSLKSKFVYSHLIDEETGSSQLSDRGPTARVVDRIMPHPHPTPRDICVPVPGL